MNATRRVLAPEISENQNFLRLRLVPVRIAITIHLPFNMNEWAGSGGGSNSGGDVFGVATVSPGPPVAGNLMTTQCIMPNRIFCHQAGVKLPT